MAFDGVSIGISDGLADGEDFSLGLAIVCRARNGLAEPVPLAPMVFAPAMERASGGDARIYVHRMARFYLTAIGILMRKYRIRPFASVGAAGVDACRE